MKYVLLVLSIFIILYPIYGLIRCFQTVGSLTSYGMGVLTGGGILLVLGITLLYFTLRLFKRKIK